MNFILNFAEVTKTFCKIENHSTAQVIEITFFKGHDAEDEKKVVHVGYEHLESLIDCIDSIKPPQLRQIEIWMEGYAATGKSGVAQKVWEGLAIDFDDAIKRYQEDRPKVQIETRSKYREWGCALFDNEADARKSFG
jgi:hypothetical protein